MNTEDVFWYSGGSSSSPSNSAVVDDTIFFSSKRCKAVFLGIFKTDPRPFLSSTVLNAELKTGTLDLSAAAFLTWHLFFLERTVVVRAFLVPPETIFSLECFEDTEAEADLLSFFLDLRAATLSSPFLPPPKSRAERWIVELLVIPNSKKGWEKND